MRLPPSAIFSKYPPAISANTGCSFDTAAIINPKMGVVGPTLDFARDYAEAASSMDQDKTQSKLSRSNAISIDGALKIKTLKQSEPDR